METFFCSPFMLPTRFRMESGRVGELALDEEDAVEGWRAELLELTTIFESTDTG